MRAKHALNVRREFPTYRALHPGSGFHYRRPTSAFFLWVSIVTCLVLAAPACGWFNSVLDEVNSAITTLDQQPTKWHSVLDDLTSKIKDQASDVANEVHGLVLDGVAATTAQGACTIEWFGHEARANLIALRDRLLLKKPSVAPVPPLICNFNPDVITLDRNSSQVPYLKSPINPAVIRIYGFNFAGSSTDLPTVEVHDANGTRLTGISGLPRPLWQTRYQLQLDVNSVDWSKFNPGYTLALIFPSDVQRQPREISVSLKPKGLSPKLLVTLNSFVLFEDEESGDTHLALYFYMQSGNGPRTKFFEWNNNGAKVNETNTYYFDSPAGLGTTHLTVTQKTIIWVEAYTHDDHAWPTASAHENSLASGSNTTVIDPTDLVGASLSPFIPPSPPGSKTTTDNGNGGIRVALLIQPA